MSDAEEARAEDGGVDAGMKLYHVFGREPTCILTCFGPRLTEFNPGHSGRLIPK